MPAALPQVLAAADLDALLAALAADGREVLGPVRQDHVLGIGAVRSTADLPVGWTDRQDAGTYRLERRADQARFGFVLGPHSWKSVLFPARTLLWSGTRDGADGGLSADVPDRVEARRPRALVGVRACELAAIAVQDRVLLGREAVDADYAARRADVVVVAVTCSDPGGTCFCASMGTGPEPADGFDLSLTELLDGEHRFVVRAGSDRGRALLADLPTRPATDDDLAAAAAVVRGSTARMGRTMPEPESLPAALRGTLEHPHWDDVAGRCLACGSCTLVCPTCFCTAVDETTDLVGTTAQRQRIWDSCFTPGFSYIHGGAVRQSTRSRYRQWLTHKLSTWVDQFGTSGCVGCGRCITWCPVGIDITAEARALVAASAPAPAPVPDPARTDR